MKRWLLLIGLLAGGAWPAAAQLIRENGVYGGPVVRVVRAFEAWGVMGGVRGAWLINRTYSVGLGGFSLLSRNIQPDYEAAPAYLQMRYGGLTLEYINDPDDAIHFSTQVLLGVGELAYAHQDTDARLLEDTFYIAEPEMMVVFVVSPVLRLGLSASFRLNTSVNLPGITGVEVSDAGLGLTVRVGAFE